MTTMMLMYEVTIMVMMMLKLGRIGNFNDNDIFSNDDSAEHDGTGHDGDEHDGNEHDGDEHDGDGHDSAEHDGDGDGLRQPPNTGSRKLVLPQRGSLGFLVLFFCK